MELDEVQLINVLQVMLHHQQALPVPPQVTNYSLALRANKPDAAWVVNAVAANEIRLPIGLVGQGISLQNGRLQQIDPVTGVTQELRDPINPRHAQMVTRQQATARTRVDEIFRTLTKDEQPVTAGQAAHAVLQDICTFTLYVHYYLA